MTTNAECVANVLASHREARQWSDEAVATDLLTQLGLDPAGNAAKAAPVVPPGITEDEVKAHEAAAKEAIAKAEASRAALKAQREADKPAGGPGGPGSQGDGSDRRREADQLRRSQQGMPPAPPSPPMPATPTGLASPNPTPLPTGQGPGGAAPPAPNPTLKSENASPMTNRPAL